MLKLPLALAALLLASSASSATTCDAIRTQIDSTIRAAGVQHYTLTTIDAGAKADGKVVGSCDLGTKKIVYLQNDGPVRSSTSGSSSDTRPAPAKPGKEVILTECKDGYVSTGSGCRKK